MRRPPDTGGEAGAQPGHTPPGTPDPMEPGALRGPQPPPPEAEPSSRGELCTRMRAAWEADRASLLADQPLLAILALQLEVVGVYDDRCRTACTDGRTIYFDPRFLAGRSDADRLFVLAHEVWHCALLHARRRLERAPTAWNVAIDHEVNVLLTESGLPLPEDAILYPDWRGASAEEVYAWIEGRSHARGPDADVHLPCPDDTPGERDPRFLPMPVSAEIWDGWPERLAAAVQQVGAGSVSARILTRLQEVLTPQTPWQEVLRAFVSRVAGGERSWARLSRRHLARGLYLPGTQQVRLRAVVAVDTSASTHELVPQFLAELRGLVASFGRYEIELVWCDCEVQAIQTFSDAFPDEPLHSVPLGGGTDFRPVFVHVDAREAPDVLVFLTDGEGPAPTRAPTHPTLWILPHGTTPPAPWGEVAWLPANKGATRPLNAPRGARGRD